MENHSTRIIQISDIHLFANPEHDLLGVKTHESFKALLDLLKSDKKPPAKIILTGDLSQDNTEQSYTHYFKYLETFSVPVYYIPGNHDDRKIMEKTFKGSFFSPSKQIILPHWQIILLDTQKTNQVSGHLDRKQLDFLEDALNKYPTLQAVIIFHHHPVPVGSAWLDQLGLNNADEFWEIVEQYSQVNTVFFGHVHQEHAGEKNGIKYFSVPSTCIQFKCNSDQFALDPLAPGYRWIDLYDNGSIKTGVNRLEHYVGTFIEDAKGY